MRTYIFYKSSVTSYILNDFICYHLYYLKKILLTDYSPFFTSPKQTLSYTSLKQRNTQATTYKNSTCKMQRHSHLSNGFMEAERWINFFNFGCVFRKNGFREKTWTLWKQKELFMILFLGLSLNFLWRCTKLEIIVRFLLILSAMQLIYSSIPIVCKCKWELYDFWHFVYSQNSVSHQNNDFYISFIFALFIIYIYQC